MKNRKKLVIILIGVIVLGIVLFVYQTFIKKQLHFKENMTVEINGKKIGYDEPVYFIAEMSANHLHNFERAKKIIQEAKYAGADAIKLQTYRPDTITIDCYTDEFMATPGSPWDGMNLYELYKTAYTPWEWHKELMEYANSIGITCFSSPFDLTAVDFLEELNVPAYKIASFEINDIPLIRKAAKTGKKYLVIVESPAKVPDLAILEQYKCIISFYLTAIIFFFCILSEEAISDLSLSFLPQSEYEDSQSTLVALFFL